MTAALAIALAYLAAGNDRILDAIERVESRGNVNAVGDGGRSIGPMQIQRAYWLDSRVPGSYEQCRDRAYARRVVEAYWRRYCPWRVGRNESENPQRRTWRGEDEGNVEVLESRAWCTTTSSIVVPQPGSAS